MLEIGQPNFAVAYYRVSRKRQAESGLGLEAQKAAVNNFIARNGFTLIDEYVEVETATAHGERTEVKKAILATQSNKATLLIARLDRLSRNVAFTSQLQLSGIPFLCVDMPTANHTTIQLMAVIAEYEAKVISQRTKDALQAAKARGVRLGSPIPMSDDVRAKGRAVSREKRINLYKPVFTYIEIMHERGMTLASIALQLNNDGFRTRYGKMWSATQVRRLIKFKSTII